MRSGYFFASGLSDFFVSIPKRTNDSSRACGRFIVVGNTLTFKASFSSPAVAPVKDTRHSANSTRFLATWMSRVSTLKRFWPASPWKCRRSHRHRRPNRTRVNREYFPQSNERRASPGFCPWRIGARNRRRLETTCASEVRLNNRQTALTAVFPGIWGSWPRACEGKGAEVDDVTTGAIQVAGTRESLNRDRSQPRGNLFTYAAAIIKDSAGRKRTAGSRRLTSGLRLWPEANNEQQNARTTT